MSEHETNAEYHADASHNGSTMLGDYEESPRLYHGLHVAKTLPPEPPTPAMVLGSLTHTLVLEPEMLGEEYTIAHGCNARRGNKWQAVAEMAAAEGKTPVPPAWIDDARAMTRAVQAHPLASTILERAESIEQPIRWTDPETGIRLKCKPDFLVTQDNTDGLVVLAPDLKTSAELAKFPSSVANYRYHIQSRLYRNGIATTLPEGAEIQSLWIVVSKTPPHDVRVFRPSPAMEFTAQLELNLLLDRLRDSFATDTWELPDSNRIETLELPRWAQH